MVAAAETLLTASKSDRRPKRESVPRLGGPSKVYWRFRLSKQQIPAALAPAVEAGGHLHFQLANLSIKTAIKANEIVVVCKNSASTMFIS